MVQYTKAQDGSALAIVTIDSPRFILAVEPLAALLEFAVAPFKNTEAPPPEEEPTPDGQTLLVEEKPAQGGLSFRIDIVNSTVIVLADDTDRQTQAIQLVIKEILVSQNNVLALKVDKLGMSFGRMDQPDDRLSFLDDVSMTLTLDTSRRGAHQMTIFDIEIPVPVIFRASINNITLILDIVNKASAAAAKALASDHAVAEAEKKETSLTVPSQDTRTSTTQTSLAPPRSSTRRASISHRRTSSTGMVKTRVLVSKEHLTLRVNGFQFVLVGDQQEMPMVHLSTSEFTCMVNDWSGELKMATSLTTSMRYFNLSNSYFEPLLDPWKFDIEVARTPTINGASPLNVKLSADQRMELSITSAFIELGITSMTVYSKQQEKQKDRGPVAPFRVRNRTGMPITIWPESDDLSSIPWHKRKTIEDGADMPWFFQDRQALRDNVSAFQHNSFGLELPDGAVKWDPVRGVSVDREGEHILNLRPRIEKVTYQLMCDIELENNIKVITIRSTLTVDNDTSLPVEMIVVDAHGKAAGSVLKIGELHPVEPS
jgi:vacuolar protein sorting-associated protein 13A/C